MLPAKIYSFSIPASGMFELPVVGNFFKVLSSSGTFSVTGDTFGGLGSILAGQGLRGADFTKLQFTDTSGAINNLRVLVAGDSFIDDRVTGEVSVVDGAKARTYSRQAFVANIFQGAVAAAMSNCQLWNPAASGKNAIVEAVACMTTNAAGGTFGAGSLSIQLATFYSNPGVKLLGAGSGLSVCSGRVTTAAAAQIAAGSQILSINGAQNQTVIYTFREPVVVPPGQGLVVWNNVLNADLTAQIEYFEEVPT